jgi:hypothetical protein
VRGALGCRCVEDDAGDVVAGDDEEGFAGAAVGGGTDAWPGCGAAGLRRAAAVPADGSVPVLRFAVVLVGNGGISVSVSVSLPPPAPVVGSGVICLLAIFFGEVFSSVDVVLSEVRASAAFAASTSRANQFIAYQRPAHSTERTAKWIECVKRRREKRTSCKAPKVALVAIKRVGVGPGVKMDSHRSTMKLDILG